MSFGPESERNAFINQTRGKISKHLNLEITKQANSSTKMNKSALKKINDDYKSVSDYYFDRVKNWESIRYVDGCPLADAEIKADVLAIMCRECWDKEADDAWAPIIKYLKSELLASLCCENDSRNPILRKLLTFAQQAGVNSYYLEDAVMQACYRLFYTSPGWARLPKLLNYNSDEHFMCWFYRTAKRYFIDYMKMEKSRSSLNIPIICADDDTKAEEIRIDIPDTTKGPFLGSQPKHYI